ncbi:hypothetical protein Z517_04636 [Fonsecaea pedrosoi CBS 271.37]|uniref:FAD/NAD(P)-binding domain-containing protein n=1 Tax=Fonsecaea pedrosoi CBS 271.37 TaxID=1442368 RepID=A0A0D2GSS3_9EURO|nr:uncharacterized protein Z517_04636 [Fonsecaea pedrosoi CBS 271.37]KIW81610.1 hypothetical protein Z517_04636 [Fonsecaea pedrosoi CBS 271.37]
MPNTENGKSKDHINGFLSMADFEGSYHVIVVGSAAIGAKQTAPQSRVLIIQSKACLGGAPTHRGVLSCCGPYSVGPPDRPSKGGRANLDGTPRKAGVVAYIQAKQKFYILELEANFGSSMSNSEELKHVLDDMIASYDIEVLPHCAVVVGERTDGRLVTVEVQERRGRRTISGKAFVDCSGDRDLAGHAGASTRYGKAITAMSTWVRWQPNSAASKTPTPTGAGLVVSDGTIKHLDESTTLEDSTNFHYLKPILFIQQHVLTYLFPRSDAGLREVAIPVKVWQEFLQLASQPSNKEVQI